MHTGSDVSTQRYWAPQLWTTSSYARSYEQDIPTVEILAHFSRTHHGNEDESCGDMDRANTCTVELKKPDSRGQTVCLKKKNQNHKV